MKKKFICLVIVVCVAILGILSGCNLINELVTKKVSTLSELKSANGKVKLVNDIDCEFETINPIYCSEFDGQGYTIKNAVISSPDKYSLVASLFVAKTIKNVTLENITLNVEKALSVAIVSGGNSKEIENVSVKNSSIKCGSPVYKNNVGLNAEGFCVGGIYGGYYRETKNGSFKKSYDCKIINCSVENTAIEVTDSTVEIYVGGIAGSCNNIYGCSVSECRVYATASTIYGYPVVGGIVGYSEGSIKNSYAINNNLRANALHYQASLFAGYSASTAYIGGITGYIKSEGEITYCYANENYLQGNSSGSVYAGGLAGYSDGTSVSQSYTKDNSANIYDFVKSANTFSHTNRRVGGLIGLSKNNSVTSCFAYNDKCFAENCMKDLNTSYDSKIAGLIAEADNISVSYCATYNINLISTIVDEFIPDPVTELTDCYVTKTEFGNKNNCEIVGDEFWIAPTIIKNSLNLEGDYWQLKLYELPCLNFKPVE